MSLARKGSHNIGTRVKGRERRKDEENDGEWIKASRDMLIDI